MSGAASRAEQREAAQTATVSGGMESRPGVMIATELPLDVVPDDARFLSVETRPRSTPRCRAQ
jgi:hypothetical protein